MAAATARSDVTADASVLMFSETRALLSSGDLAGDFWEGVASCRSASWEQSTPSIVAWMTTPPSSARGLGQGGLKSSAEDPSDGGTGLKSSGVLEETDGGVWVCLGGVFSGLPADWTAHLPLRIKVWLRVQVVRN